ncbi:hypothetical protein [Peribacillus asahii]|uniref:hypothetical protein n=1 Tax=Peribacillus asahii TaxID=228899 RepID=UPI00207A249C|nr:hypothetical protein [Peribacillus asahii]USK72618.1 hypothetical protein LIS76_23525 [Peribacillus asahii]USK72734.1 hypothetical protein LIS76_23705 [Peribacillus asahii]
MKQDMNSSTTTTETRKQRKQRLKMEKKQDKLKNHFNGLSPAWLKYQVFATTLPNLVLGIGGIVFLIFVIFGILPPQAIIALFGMVFTYYLGK